MPLPLLGLATGGGGLTGGAATSGDAFSGDVRFGTLNIAGIGSGATGNNFMPFAIAAAVIVAGFFLFRRK